MKKTFQQSFKGLNSRELSILTQEVKETLATSVLSKTEKVFTSAELWNIQRQARVRVSRRFL